VEYTRVVYLCVVNFCKKIKFRLRLICFVTSRDAKVSLYDFSNYVFTVGMHIMVQKYSLCSCYIILYLLIMKSAL